MENENVIGKVCFAILRKGFVAGLRISLELDSPGCIIGCKFDGAGIDRPRGAVSAGDHQRPASAGIRLQKRRSRAAALRNVFPPPAVFCLPWLDSGLHGLLPRLPVSKEPYAGRQREADHAVCAGLRDVPVRYSLSVGPSRRPVVVRRYERDVLPAVCRHL